MQSHDSEQVLSKTCLPSPFDEKIEKQMRRRSRRSRLVSQPVGLIFSLRSCSRGRAGSTTSCESARPSWSSSARRTSSRTTSTSWTTLARWCSSWWTSTARPRGPTTSPGERRSSERTLCRQKPQPASGLYILSLSFCPRLTFSQSSAPLCSLPPSAQTQRLRARSFAGGLFFLFIGLLLACCGMFVPTRGDSSLPIY